ncbi:MAG: sulfide/dihydroorotate dehydrogenase-like FAD/NAD-binding protein [Candidatus Omnitrophica bacterium]|nr:sulfide/dihydroorotate dehydrogenase-like FAD/NAD-binding protein [Candidatus Omnitrophota bacterium]
MYKIVHKHVIALDIKKIDITAPDIASKALPGQFVMVMPLALMHAIPMTIIDHDERRGLISLLVHEVGPATKALGGMSITDEVYQVVGPLGQAAQMGKYGLVICVATGIGAAQILPVCRGLKKRGNKVVGIIGAKSKKELMLEAQMRVVCDEIFIATNDGSYERRGLATTILQELLNKYKVHRVYAIGSVDMMKAASVMTREKNIPLRVTINTYMVNGLGTCGSCRVKIGGGYQLACMDGPEFDGHLVDFQDLSQRMNTSGDWENNIRPVGVKTTGFGGLRRLFWPSTKK